MTDREAFRKKFAAEIEGAAQNGSNGTYHAAMERGWIAHAEHVRAEAIAVAQVVESDHAELEARIRWLLNPMPDGTLLYEVAAQQETPR